MAKITRKTAKLFATAGAGTDVEQFASFEVNGAPNYTTSPAVIMALPAWSLGWSSTQFDGIFAPYFQDRNAVDLVAFYQIAYLLQQGIAEWDSGTIYFTNSLATHNGSIYLSLKDNNVGNTPPITTNALWYLIFVRTPQNSPYPTRTVLTAGAGTYTPPAGCVRIFVRMVGGGGGGAGFTGYGSDGGNTTLGTLMAGGGARSSSSGLGGGGGVASGGDININGASGGNGFTSESFPGQPSAFGGSGGVSVNSMANTGAGGGTGAGVSSGGAGSYLEAVVYLPGSLSYSVGAAGAGGSGSGFSGGSGLIVIDEFYY